jgi:hypothetical protein
VSNTTSDDKRKSKDAIIAAIATVLAAVIAASATIITSKQRDLSAARTDVAVLQDQDAARTRRIAELESQLAACKSNTGANTSTQPPTTGSQDNDFPPTALAHQQEHGFDVAFHGCRRLGSKVVCYFMITNLKNECNFTLLGKVMDGSSRIVDSSGLEHWPSIAELGGTEYYAPHASIASSAPLRASLTFESLPGPADTIPLLQLSFSSCREYRAKVDFRTIKIDT